MVEKPSSGRKTAADQKAVKVANTAVAAYKTILKTVLDNRPSGTRQRLAEALNKNRSFVSQIANPAYLTPIPAQHLQTIFEICHFSPKERQQFTDCYASAHPRRLRLVENHPATRTISLTVPDLGNRQKNQEFDELILQFVKRVAHLAQGTNE